MNVVVTFTGRKFVHTFTCCNLSIATHSEKIHKQINLIVNKKFLVAMFGQLATENPMVDNKNAYFCIFLPQVYNG